MAYHASSAFRRFYRTLGPFLILAVGISIGFGISWLDRLPQVIKKENVPQTTSPALRLSGYSFISPLLVCDTNPAKGSPELKNLEQSLHTVLDQEIQANHLRAASIYFRDITSGAQVDINPESLFFPASLNKIPVMIAYYKLAEADPSILKKQYTVKDINETDSSLEIQPKEYARLGESYTVEELISLMIKYSDNNAFYILLNNLDSSTLLATFRDLQITIPPDQTSGPDFMTTNSFSYFLRILYNATYLNREYSERALRTLSDIDFQDGLTAGLPKGIVTAHKFGLVSYFNTDGSIDHRELHDCGIIYHSSNPYLLCVMTKSKAPLADVQSSIQVISSTVYQAVDRGFQP